MIIDAAILLFALIVLAKSSEIVVNNTLKLSRFFGLSELAAGFILISFSTSIPELAVSLEASMRNASGIAVGNIFGSNIVDMCLAIGSCALIGTLYIRGKEWRTMFRILFITSLIPLFLVLFGGISMIGGILLVALFVWFVDFVRKSRIVTERDHVRVTKHEAMHALVIFVLALVAVIISSKVTVDYALVLVDRMGVAPSFVGATIIAFGTALPELAVDITATRKGKINLALGDVLGSAIINQTLVLGTAALINPAKLDISFFVPLLVSLVIVNIVVWYMIETKRKITAKDGLVLITSYFLFLMLMFGIQLKEMAPAAPV